METQERICRFCLEICNNSKVIEGDMEDVLNILMPKIDLTAVQKPMVCAKCTQTLKKCFDFKMICLNAHDNIVKFVNNKNSARLDLKDVYLSKNENGPNDPEGHNICGFCTSPVKSCSAIFLDGESDIMLQNMIKQCLPELDISIIKKPVICPPCHCCLENCFRFVTNCLIVDGKIKKYRESPDVNSKDHIKLSSLLQFTIKDVARSELDGSMVDVIKVEKQLCEEREYDEREIGKGHDTLKLEQSFIYDNIGNVKEEVVDEHENLVDMDGMKFNNEEQLVLKCKEESYNPDVIKTEAMFCGENEISDGHDMFKLEQNSFCDDIKNAKEEIECKNKRLDEVAGPQEEVSTKLQIKDTSVNKNVSKMSTYQCECCSFQTSYKRSLIAHFLVHKDPSELKMYKCESCPFQTKRKNGLTAHLLLHKNPSEVTMYKCDYCLYRTKSKRSLKDHLLIHKVPSGITLYKCDYCSFQTRHKSAFRRHLISHEDSSEVTMYKCDTCCFQTKYKYYLKSHLLIHKDPSEVTMYKCESCSFQTKRKYTINRHLLIHTDPSEVKILKCGFCDFQTKRKYNLGKHLLLHKTLQK